MRDTVRRLIRSPFGASGLALFGALLLTALFAPLIATQDPIALTPRDALQGPSPAHLFGTDDLGRDVFSRVIWGSRLAVRLGVLSVLIAASGGVVLGLLAGFYGRWVDNLISRLLEVVLAFPGILFAIAIVAILGPSLDNLIVALGLFGWPGYARIVRGSVLSAKQREYVEAARAMGATGTRIMTHHLLPNVVAPVIILSATRFGGALLAGSGLSFIGLGVPIPQPEWGAIMATGRQYLDAAWWVFAFPGGIIFFAVLGVNLLGDGLRDVLDPRLRV
jgi:peptide/nickel transport system permease protein